MKKKKKKKKKKIMMTIMMMNRERRCNEEEQQEKKNQIQINDQDEVKHGIIIMKLLNSNFILTTEIKMKC